MRLANNSVRVKVSFAIRNISTPRVFSLIGVARRRSGGASREGGEPPRAVAARHRAQPPL